MTIAQKAGSREVSIEKKKTIIEIAAADMKHIQISQDCVIPRSTVSKIVRRNRAQSLSNRIEK